MTSRSFKYFLHPFSIVKHFSIKLITTVVTEPLTSSPNLWTTPNSSNVMGSQGRLFFHLHILLS